MSPGTCRSLNLGVHWAQMTNSFKIHQLVEAPRAKVYEAWSDLDISKKWSAPEGCHLSVFDADLRIGGKYRLTMVTPGGEMSAYGVYREITAGQRIVYTWVWDVPDTEENLVTVEFHDKGKDTDVVLSVSGFTAPDEVESNQVGWASSLSKLAALFEK
jgi:uncharacterized protein YndB with AHSA1/START domain